MRRTKVICPDCGGTDHNASCPHLRLRKPATWRDPWAVFDFLQQHTVQLNNDQIIKRLQLFPDIRQFYTIDSVSEELGGGSVCFAILMREARIKSKLLKGLNETERRDKVREEIDKKISSKKYRADDGTEFKIEDIIVCSEQGQSKKGLLHRPYPGSNPLVWICEKCNYDGCSGTYIFAWEFSDNETKSEIGGFRRR